MPDDAACRVLLLALAICACADSDPAPAQAVDQTLADVAQAQSVNVRSRTDAAAQSIVLGATQLLLTVDGKLIYDDNVYDTDTGAVADGELILTPHADWKVKAGDVALTLSGNASIERYASLTTEDANQYDLTAAAQWQPERALTVDATGFIGRHHEIRGTLGDIVVGAPSRYDVRGGTLGLNIVVGQVALAGGGGVQTLSYLPVELDGQTVSESYRSRTVYTANAGGSVALSPGVRAFAHGDYNAQAYQTLIGTADQNSHGYALTGGIALGIDELISGQFDVGYLAQKYADAALGTVGGLTYDARITWNPTPLMTAMLTGGRTLQQSPFYAQGGVLEDSLALHLDYWPLRRLIVSGEQSIIFDSFRGIDRNDRRYTSVLSFRYLSSRSVELDLQLLHRDQTSQGADARPYVGNSAMVNVVIKR